MIWEDAYKTHKRRKGTALRLVSKHPRLWEVVATTTDGTPERRCTSCGKEVFGHRRKWCAADACQLERRRIGSQLQAARKKQQQGGEG